MSALPPPRATYKGSPLYRGQQAPRYLRTYRQLIDEFDLKPGAPARAYVETSYGAVALFKLNEAELAHPESETADPHPDA
jgi:hypothetical protein